MSEASTPPAAPKVSDYAYPDFYRAMIEREHLQVSKDEVAWTERHVAPDRPIDVLLNFGCNVRQTPHLMREAVAVFEILGVDFAAVAGQQFCCGKPYTKNGQQEVAMHVVEASVRRMAAYEPRRAIQWCSACEVQFHDVVKPELGLEFQSDGLAGFLIEKLDELGDRVPWQRDASVRALVHGHVGEHRIRDGHVPLAIQILERIPGVDVIGAAQTPALDICDGAGVNIATIGTAEYAAYQARLEGYLRDAGADTIVTLYHGCTRELGKFVSERLAVRHYISILAEALGCAKPDRFSQYWRLGDPDKIVEASRANWQSWGIDEMEARRLAHKYFVPSYAANAPDCPCNGECTRTGAVWLQAGRVKRLIELPQANDLSNDPMKI